MKTLGLALVLLAVWLMSVEANYSKKSPRHGTKMRSYKGVKTHARKGGVKTHGVKTHKVSSSAAESFVKTHNYGPRIGYEEEPIASSYRNGLSEAADNHDGSGDEPTFLPGAEDRGKPDGGEEAHYIPQGGKIDIYSFYVTSTIRHRFATTYVTSRVANTFREAKEVTFYMHLPNEAFIANFSMEVSGRVKYGTVQEKEEAKSIYDANKERGQSGAHVAATPRESNAFTISINVAAHSSAVFNLTYQELLERKLGYYEHVININPGQVVHDMRIQVNIEESVEITNLRVPALRRKFQRTAERQEPENDMAIILTPTDNTAEIIIEPTAEEQKAVSASGIVGQFAVQYDVLRRYDGGNIELMDGYFVHYFAPQGLTPLSKDVVFILDISGSMAGRKIAQLRESMDIILQQLRPGDRFNIILFDDNQYYWKQDMLVDFTSESLSQARQFCSQIIQKGSTNINDALIAGITLLRRHTISTNVPIIIFLTDGTPTVGIQNANRILRNVRTVNEGRIPIYSLGYGMQIDYTFLKRLSLQSHGIARRIYEESDAFLQLEGFYAEVASPMLRNVTFTYVGESVEQESVTTTYYPLYFSGSELVVSGRLDMASLYGKHVGVRVTGMSSKGRVEFDFPIVDCVNSEEWYDSRCPSGPDGVVAPQPGGQTYYSWALRRLWAYLTIKRVLRERDAATDLTAKLRLERQAIDMSIQWQFVTTVTSIVVTEEDEQPLPPSNLVDSNTPTYGPGGRRPHAWGDVDPHILVVVGGVPVCFNLDGSDGEEYLLFDDSHTDLKVYGELLGRPNQPNKTFFDTITFKMDHVKVQFDARSHQPLVPKISGSKHAVSNLPFRMSSRKRVVNLAFKHGLVLSIHFGAHKFGGHSVRFLGLYINSKAAYTETCEPDRFGGVIGQFMCDSAEVMPVMAPPEDLEKDFHNLADLARLDVWDESGFHREVFAAPGHRENLRRHQEEYCWFVHDQAQGIMKHDILSFRLK